jgi:hypothetical protein
MQVFYNFHGIIKANRRGSKTNTIRKAIIQIMRVKYFKKQETIDEKIT